MLTAAGLRPVKANKLLPAFAQFKKSKNKALGVHKKKWLQLM
jgi:hypothetical protein